jgi:hypothetical protein
MHPEGTFGRLRYPLGGDRPSQTTRLALSRRRVYGRRLGALPRESGISPSPPRRPRAAPRRLPPILRGRGPAPRPRCSKAPRGLFVLSQVTRIFTGASISPSPPSRQRSSRYAFRAGRNLPDKEFRYLRTVIVTAAVHRGFGSRLRAPLPLTSRHWAGVSPHTAARAVAETCVFGKQSLEPAPCGPLALPPARRRGSRYAGRPFSRSYGANLPSSLTGDRSSTSGVCPPAHRCRCAVRVARARRARGFSRRPRAVASGASPAPRRPPRPRAGPGLPWAPAATGRPALSVRPADALGRVPAGRSRARVRDCPPVVHRLRRFGLRPRLRPRLTLGRLPLPRNPQARGVGGSRPHRRYSFRHSRFGSLHRCSRSGFPATPERSPTAPGAAFWCAPGPRLRRSA